LIYAAGRPHLENSDMHIFDEKFFLKSSASNSEVKLKLIVKLMSIYLGEKDGLN
jgi:hypothetical protein